MTDYQGSTLAADRQPENRITVTVDAEGYVCGEVVRSKTATSDDFFTLMKRLPNIPLDQADIVLPEGFELDSDGRAVKVVRDADGSIIARLTTELLPKGISQ